MSNSNCPFCDEEKADHGIRGSTPEVSYVKCSLCGEFEYAPRMVSELEDEKRSKIRVLLQVRKLRGLGRICLLDTVPVKTKGLCFDPIDKDSFLHGRRGQSRNLVIERRGSAPPRSARDPGKDREFLTFFSIRLGRQRSLLRQGFGGQAKVRGQGTGIK